MYHPVYSGPCFLLSYFADVGRVQIVSRSAGVLEEKSEFPMPTKCRSQEFTGHDSKLSFFTIT